MIFGRHETCRQVRATASAAIVVSISLLLAFAPNAAVGEPGSCTVSSFASTDVPKAVPDPGSVESALAVTAGDSVSGVDVAVTISHPFDSDLRIDLVSPAGTAVTLARALGVWGDNFTDTAFDDEASTSIVSVLPPFTGHFRPVEPLSVLDGSPRSGTWKLRVTDERGRYAGQIQGWSLDITSCPGTPPASPVTPGAPDPPPLPTGVPAGAEPMEGTLVTVTTNSDASNGDVSSVPNLQANPGPDGISLREAILATNNDPGEYTIRFGPTLVGTTIQVGSTGEERLPQLRSSGVLIDGDIDGDGRPDVTLANAISTIVDPGAIIVASGGNRLHALDFEGFANAVVFGEPDPGETFSRNVVTGCAFDLSEPGVEPGHGVNVSSQVDNMQSTDIRIVGNVVQHGGISFALHFVSDTSLRGITVAGNTIQTTGNTAIGMAPGHGPESPRSSISDGLIAYNSIAGTPISAIWLSSGSVGSSENSIDRVGVIGNHISFSSPTHSGGAGRNAIVLQAGDASSAYGCPECVPIVYPNDNTVQDIVIDGNRIEGQGGAGVWLTPSGDGAARNSIEGVQIRGNVIASDSGVYANAQGVFISGAGPGTGGRMTTDTLVSDVDVEGNTIAVTTTNEAGADLLAGGVVVTAAIHGAASRNQVADVRVNNNRIDAAGFVGISLLGGVDVIDDATAAEDNAVSEIHIARNLIARAPTGLLSRYPWIKGINLVGGLAESGGAVRNSVTSVTLEDNLVAGVLDDVSVRSNVGAGASDNLAALGLRPPTLTVAKAGSGSGTVGSDPAGIDCGSTCSYDFDDRSQVTLAAQAAAGSVFGGWSGGGCSGTGSCVVTMDAGKTVSATFLALRTLVVGRSGSGTGTVSSAPAGIDCGSTCSYDFADWTSVTLTAGASAGSTFARWSGVCSGTGPCTVTMDQNRSATATFESDKTLTVTKEGSGSGTITSSPGGIDCGSTCAHAYMHGSSVTLAATASSGSIFTGWSGECSGTGTCTLAMSASHSATATFESDKTLTISKAGGGSGWITVNPLGMSCGSNCTHSFAHGTTVTLAPHAASGSRFAGWSGDCSGFGTCKLTMSRDRLATMRFEALCIVPRLKGKTLAAAKRAIKTAKCSLGRVRSRYSAKKKGTVIAQTPAPGTRVARGSRVGLLVSRGKRS